MKLTKREALSLVKVLVRHSVVSPVEHNDDLFLGCIQEDLEHFLLSDDEEKRDEEAEDDYKAPADPSGFADEEGGEGEGEEGEPEEGGGCDDREAQVEADACIYAADLIALKPFNAAKKRAKKAVMRFHCGTLDSASLAVGSQTVNDVTHVVRRLKELHVLGGDACTWHVFAVAKFPLPWMDLLTFGEVFEVVT
jgi:hypothetical protein